MDGRQGGLWTVAQVSLRLSVTERTVRNWIAAGTLKATRIGGVVRVEPADVEELIRNGQSEVRSAGSERG